MEVNTKNKKKLIIPGTEDTPHIHIDLNVEKFQMEGQSLPEDVQSFYEPIMEWLKNNISNVELQIVVEMKFSYFNSASSKQIWDILKKLEESVINKNSKILVKWYYPEEDEDMEDAGNSYDDLCESLDFEHISY